MAFIENLERLAYEQGKSLTEITNEAGMASSVISKWRAGSIPRNATLKKIADHFGVTVDYLLSDNPPPVTKWDSAKETSEYGTLTPQEKQLVDIYRELTTEMGKMRLIQAVLNVYDRETNR
jgi:transcriptional regulator with XRE-family HTH domain